ncbi:MAG: hypothetical protein AB8H03_08450 [Saprospiraceae bacterium]
MKNLTFILFLSILAFGCKKDDAPTIEKSFTAQVDGTEFIASSISYVEIFGIILLWEQIVMVSNSKFY